MSTTDRGTTGAMVIAALLGEYSLLILPFIVTAMIKLFGVSVILAGRLVSLQLVCMAVASITASVLLVGRNPRAISAFAASAIIIANALCALSKDPHLMIIGRALTGLGEGTLMAAAAGIIAATADPHRIFSLEGLAVAVVAALALVSIPAIVTHFGQSGTFWMLTICPLALFATLHWLPSTGASGDTAARLPLMRPDALALLFAFGALWAGAGGLWVFAERIGSDIGLTFYQVGISLAIGQLAGIAGPIAAARWGLRMGLRRSLFLGCLGMAGGGFLFVLGGSGVTYTLGACILSFLIMYLVPCFRSLMSQIDPSGRVVGASAAFYTVGFALAPALATLVMTPGKGYASVSILSGAFLGVSAAAIAFTGYAERLMRSRTL